MKQKNRIFVFSLLLTMAFVLMLTNSCSNAIPELTTSVISNLASTSATCGGNITDDNDGDIESRGVCWATFHNPTKNNDHTSDGIGGGEFSSSITGLAPSTTYYVRAYATNCEGTGYGKEVSFTTLGLSLGTIYGGGIIFYLDGTGQHGLIAATTNQGSQTWGILDNPIGGTDTLLGTGQNNTTAIVNGCSETNIAARICNNLELNGYSDWFLPSKAELNKMYQQKNFFSFDNSYFWSSSEWEFANGAWRQNLYNGAQEACDVTSHSYVQAIRAF